jgi:hypothetical protein
VGNWSDRREPCALPTPSRTRLSAAGASGRSGGGFQNVEAGTRRKTLACATDNARDSPNTKTTRQLRVLVMRLRGSYQVRVSSTHARRPQLRVTGSRASGHGMREAKPTGARLAIMRATHQNAHLAASGRNRHGPGDSSLRLYVQSLYSISDAARVLPRRMRR